MTKMMNQTKIILSLAAGVFFTIFNDGCMAQQSQGSDGWADYGMDVTGGGDGEKILVSNRVQLLDAIGRSNCVIQISDTIKLKDGERINVKVSHLTIEGVGEKGMIRNGGFNLLGSNIIVRNLSIGDAYQDGHWDGKGDPTTDAITVYGSHIWIDHCELFHGFDGLLDVSSKGKNRTGDLITVSWTRFSDHNKVMLIGSNDHCDDCRGKLRVTVHHCWFDGASLFFDSVDGEYYRVQQRMPRVRYGEVHVFNNYYEDVGDYGIAARFESSVYVEGNYFRNLRDPHIIDDMGKGTRDPALVLKDNLYDNVKGERASNGEAFLPGDYYDYSPDPPLSVPSLVMNNAGRINRKSNRAPLAEPDHFQGEAGKELLYYPLENDGDPDGDSIRIALVKPPDGVEVKTFADHIIVRAEKPGSYALKYQVIDFQGGESWSTATLVTE